MRSNLRQRNWTIMSLSFTLLQFVSLLALWGLHDGMQAARLTCSRMQNANLWTLRDGTCYLLRNEEKRKYTPGRDTCQVLCSEFTAPNSADENEFIRTTFLAGITDTPNKLWLGCNNTDGSWACLGDTESNRYRNWDAGESSLLNQCALMIASGMWESIECDNQWPKWTMCEAPAEPLICPLRLRCYAVVKASGVCPVPRETQKVASALECCHACARRCNCRSFSLAGNLDCQMNLGKINDPETTLQNQLCTYYEYDLQD